jgi:hypothetical protein
VTSIGGGRGYAQANQGGDQTGMEVLVEEVLLHRFLQAAGLGTANQGFRWWKNCI